MAGNLFAALKLTKPCTLAIFLTVGTRNILLFKVKCLKKNIKNKISTTVIKSLKVRINTLKTVKTVSLE